MSSPLSPYRDAYFDFWRHCFTPMFVQLEAMPLHTKLVLDGQPITLTNVTAQTALRLAQIDLYNAANARRASH